MRRLGKRKYDRRLPLPRPSEILPPGRFTTLRNGDGWAPEVAESDLTESLTCWEPREEALGLGPCDPSALDHAPSSGKPKRGSGRTSVFFHCPFSSCCHFDCLSPQTLLRHRDLPWTEGRPSLLLLLRQSPQPSSGHGASDHLEIRTTCPQKCDHGFPSASSASCPLAEPRVTPSTTTTPSPHSLLCSPNIHKHTGDF